MAYVQCPMVAFLSQSFHLLDAHMMMVCIQMLEFLSERINILQKILKMDTLAFSSGFLANGFPKTCPKSVDKLILNRNLKMKKKDFTRLKTSGRTTVSKCQT